MFDKLRHLFTPHHTNNYRAKILHNAGLVAVIAIFITFSSVSRLLESSSSHILGFTSSVTVEEVILQTNKERLSLGLPELKISKKLTVAAQQKAEYMFRYNFWAHIAPDGTTPWKFILDAGYDYIYAGENLAKDFSNTPRMMQAWMNSPTHRANIVSDKYTDIGVAVVPGKLEGKDTVLVVQMFGKPKSEQLSETKGTIKTLGLNTNARDETTQPPSISQMITNQNKIIKTGLLDEFKTEKNISILTMALILVTLVFDLAIAESKNLYRRVGKNWAHIIFINVILIALIIIRAGKIL